MIILESDMHLRRRTFLQLMGLGTAAGMIGGCDSVGSVFGRMFAMPPRETMYFTPNDKFYVVNYMDSPYNLSRDLNQEQWRLSISGEVKHPMTLGWRDVLNRDSFDQVVTLECIDTLPGGDSLGNAMWRGISLKKLLEEAGVDEETARDVVFKAADGYDDSIPFKRAMQDDVMLAYLMNGEKLPKAHGFPLRLLVPGLYGIKNVKWITEIQVYNGDYLGYWQRQGWTDDGTIKIFSRIDSPGHYQALQGPEQVFRGIAFGGPRTISKVEISFDAGKNWNDAELEPPPVSLLMGDLELPLASSKKRQIPSRRPRHRHRGQPADCRTRPPAAGRSEWSAYDHCRCGKPHLAAAENACQLRSQSCPSLRRTSECTPQS